MVLSFCYALEKIHHYDTAVIWNYKRKLQAKPLVHVVLTNAFYIRGDKNVPYPTTPKLNFIETPSFACMLVFTKIFIKNGFKLMTSWFWRHQPLFWKMTLQAVQILFFDANNLFDLLYDAES